MVKRKHSVEQIIGQLREAEVVTCPGSQRSRGVPVVAG